MSNLLRFPGFVDVHVHFRDPGVPEAETTASGLAAAHRGGFAAVVTMPNTTPAIDSPEMVRSHVSPVSCHLSPLLLTSACITKGRLGKEVAELEALAEAGAAFFTDDGTYVSDQHVLEEAMRRAYDLNCVVCQHALSPRFTEAEAIARDLSVCRETGCRYHVQHISTAKGVELIREAQREGLPVTAEATPHHLLLTRDDIPSRDPACDGMARTPCRAVSDYVRATNFKMAPPLATKEDRAELRKAVKEGLLMFATDHAPHPFAKKNVPYAEAANGIVGLETAIPVTYAVMVEAEGMSVDAWARAWYEKPLDILPASARALLRGTATEIVVGEARRVETAAFASRSRNCPYDGLVFNTWPHPME